MIGFRVLCSFITVSVIASMGGHQPKIDPLPTGLPPANLTASPTILRAARSADWRPMSFKVIYDNSVNSLASNYKNKLKKIVNKVVTFYNKLLSVKETSHIIVQDTCGNQMAGKWKEDYVLLVKMSNTCSKGMQGSAKGCGFIITDGQRYRINSGEMNLCAGAFQREIFDHDDGWFNVIRHEMAHALGFTDAVFDMFRDEDNKYHTGRPPQNTNRAYRLKHDGALPNVVKEVTREWKVPSGTRSHKVWMLTTPAVVREVRDHFDCSDLEGAELENHGGEGTQHSHFETRVFQSEMMSGTQAYTMGMSRITLAVFEDMGWYKVNYDMAEPMEWGKGKGCDFAKNSCYEWMDNEEDPFPFCTKFQHKVCSSSRKEVLTCQLFDSKPDKPEYRYFESRPFMGYGRDFGDFCPYYSVGSAALHGGNDDSLCMNPQGKGTDGTHQLFGTESRCFSMDSSTPHYPTAGCFHTKCNTDDDTYTVKTKDGDAVECPAGETITIKKPTHSFTLQCPSYEEICPKKRTDPDTSTLPAKYTVIYFSVFLVLSKL